MRLRKENTKDNYKDKEWLKSQYATLNRNPEDIAKECGVDTVTIYRQLRDFDLLKQRKSIIQLKEHPTYQNKKWLEERYVTQKKTTKEIADEINVDANTILTWLKIHNIKIRGSHTGIWIDKEWLKHQYLDLNKSADRIARESGTSESNIFSWLKRHGIEIRHHIWKRDPATLPGKYSDKEWLKQQYIDSRKTTVEIAKECGVSHGTIAKWLKKFSIPIRNLSEQQLKGDEKYIDETWLYNQYWDLGKTLDQIGKEFNVSYATVFKWMKKFNIPTRDVSEYKSPSGLEQRFIQFIEKYQLPFKFVGTNASEKLDTSRFSDVPWDKIYPDFKHETKKIAIELGDKRQKIRMMKLHFDNWQELEKTRRKAYEKLGWRVIFVWQDEFDKNPNKVLDEIKKVI